MRPANPTRNHAPRILTTGRTLAIVMAAAILPIGGCLPAGGTAFRNTALPAIQTGVSSILDGVVNGVFAAIAVEPASQSSDNSGSSSSDQR